MAPRVIKVKPEKNFSLLINFDNGEEKIFDMKPYLHIGVFRELQDVRLFASVKPFLGAVCWKNGQDLSPETLYLESRSLN